jgi:halimadienyl-diphosphate synthase
MIDAKEILQATGSTRINNSAYDTAWVARLSDVDPDLANEALQWICRNQLPDGGWGAERPFYYHDRVVCSLSAMIALTRRGRRAADRFQVERGLSALETIVSGATMGLRADPNGATMGFEMIVPTLVAEAEALGIIKQQGDRILGRLRHQRAAKMAKLSGLKISRRLTAAYSAEMVGPDHLDMLDIENLQEKNGSVGNSPAATAFFLQHVQRDEKALQYLRRIATGGGVPTITPIDLFERVWVLWNLVIADLHKNKEIADLCRPHIDYLEAYWLPGRGLGFSRNYSVPDGDDTSVGYSLLHTFGRKTDLDAILTLEEEKWFRCYPLELQPSLDVNIHILGALHRAGYPGTHPAVAKIMNWVRERMQPGHFWIDKWHVSPFYTTAHVIIHCHPFDQEMCRAAVEWMLSKQNQDGSWGFCGFPTAEETAYCLQALSIWRKLGNKLDRESIQRGKDWLIQHCDPPYPPLWLGKSLYRPDLLVQSAIVSSLALCEE